MDVDAPWDHISQGANVLAALPSVKIVLHTSVTNATLECMFLMGLARLAQQTA